jgi:hypothetical protein
MLLELRRNPNVKSCFAFGDTLHVTIGGERRRGEEEKGEKEKGEKEKGEKEKGEEEYLKDYLVERGYQNITIKKIKPNIEDCYMKLSQSS